MSQPSPKPNNSQPIHEQVIEDMKRRAESGKASYGTYLQVNNGRDPLLDAYEEAMDMALYLKQAILERPAVNRERILGAIEVLELATEFDFGPLPGNPDHWSNRVLIQRREGAKLPKQPFMWAVKWSGNNLSKDGEWEYEPIASSRDDEFYARCRFDTFEDAMQAARAAIDAALAPQEETR